MSRQPLCVNQGWRLPAYVEGKHMRRSRHISRRPLLTLLMLSGAVLACTLSLSGDKKGTSGGSSGGSSGGADMGIVPTVRILDPASGAQVPRNQRVDITVETDSTADRFQVNVDGRVAVTKAMPPEQSGPTKAILGWTPDRDGTYNLEVIAFRGSSASAPAALILDVSGTASGPAAGVAGCVGRVLVSQLNFRDGPGTAANRLGQFDVGETVTVIGRNADGSWYKVQRFNAQQVWAINNAQWLQVEGQCDGVPVVG
jgi:hypothetical protein